MGLGCGVSLIKYILFVFNLLCALCGIAILALGVSLFLQLDALQLKEDGFQAAQLIAILSISLGAIIFLVAFFGCCGAINESTCMTSMYSTMLMLLLIIQIVFAVNLFLNRDQIKHEVEQVLEKLWINRTSHKQFWDSVQSNFKCCGLHSPFEWVPNTPDSCCSEGTTVCTAITAYGEGCLSSIGSLAHKSGVLAYVVLGVAGIELLGVIFACFLVNSIRNQERRYA